jgi:hypothetical protein
MKLAAGEDTMSCVVTMFGWRSRRDSGPALGPWAREATDRRHLIVRNWQQLLSGK